MQDGVPTLFMLEKKTNDRGQPWVTIKLDANLVSINELKVTFFQCSGDCGATGSGILHKK